jgi:hypothetical protein
MTYFFKVYTFENTDTSNEHKNFLKKNNNHEKMTRNTSARVEA